MNKRSLKSLIKQSMNRSQRLFGFCGWLTTRPEATVMRSSAECGGIANKIRQFIQTNDLPEVRDDWTDELTHPKQLKQAYKPYIKKLLEFVTPNLLYNMYFSEGLAAERSKASGRKDEQLRYLDSYILKKLKNEYLQQLSYRLIRQGRYLYVTTNLIDIGAQQFFIAICNKDSASDRAGKSYGHWKLMQSLIAINQIYDWQKLRSDIDRISRARDSYLQDPFAYSGVQGKYTQGHKKLFGNMLMYFFRQDLLSPGAKVQDIDVLFTNTQFRDTWRSLKKLLQKSQLQLFIYSAQRLGYHAQQLSKADFGKYIDVFADKFRKQPLKIVRQYYGNQKLTVDDFINLFKSLQWDRDYGGQSWYNIGLEYKKLLNTQKTDQLKQLLDHINDLVHNSGTILSKFKYGKQILQALNKKKSAENIDMLYSYIDDPDLKAKYRQYYPMIQRSKVPQRARDSSKEDKTVEINRQRSKQNNRPFATSFGSVPSDVGSYLQVGDIVTNKILTNPSQSQIWQVVKKEASYDSGEPVLTVKNKVTGKLKDVGAWNFKKVRETY